MKKMFFMMMVAIATISCSKDDPAPPVPVESTPTVTLTVSSENVPYGSNVNVSWTSTNAKTVTLNGEAVATSGSKDYSNMILTTKFSATATNVVKTTSVEKTVTVGDEPAPVVVITTTPNDAVLPYGNKVTITWSVTNAKTITLDGVAVAATGTKEVQPLANTTYTLKAVNVTKETTLSKVINVSAWNTTRFGLLTHNGAKWFNGRDISYGPDGTTVTVLWPITPVLINHYLIYKTDYIIREANLSSDPVWYMSEKDISTWEFVENETKLRRTTHVINSSGIPFTIVSTYWIVLLNEKSLHLADVNENLNGSHSVYVFEMH